MARQPQDNRQAVGGVKSGAAGPDGSRACAAPAVRAAYGALTHRKAAPSGSCNHVARCVTNGQMSVRRIEPGGQRRNCESASLLSQTAPAPLIYLLPHGGSCYGAGMRSVTRRFMQILARQPLQPAPIRWLAAGVLFALAFTARFWLGALHGANPALTFYPAIIMAAVLLGWKEALVILALSVTAGPYLFLPPRMYLLPIAWLFIGGLNIAIIAGLKSLAEQLAASNERQRLLFQELQHRVANTLQTLGGTIEIAKRRINSAPDEAVRLLDDALERLSAPADVHRRLHDPALFHRGLDGILRDAVTTVVDRQIVMLHFDIEPLDLTFDQMSTITMVVIEMANNSQKHVFQYGRGSALSISLKMQASGNAMLIVKDDGPGQSSASDAEQTGIGLGLRIIEGLVQQIGGVIRVRSAHGTEVSVEFPPGRR